MRNKSTKQLGRDSRSKIMAHIQAHQILLCADSLDEIADAVGMAKSNVMRQLDIMAKQGIIIRPKGVARHIEIVQVKK